MWVEGSGWMVTGVGAPVAAVFLLWAALVLHCDRRRWRSQDPLLMALLLESVLQQAGACLSTVVLLFRPGEEGWCSALVWWVAAVRTLQAGTLATLASSRLFRVRYSHLIYHLVCLTLMSACVGVAAVLARTDPCEDSPDRRYVVFFLALHFALAFASFVGLVCSCCRPKIPPEADCFVNHARRRRQLLNSSSDLSSAMSDISMISTMRSRNGKGISHSVSDCSTRIRHSLVEELLRISPVSSGHNPPVTFLNSAPPNKPPRGCPHYDSPPELQLPCAAILEETQLVGCDIDAGSYGISTLRATEPCYLSTSTSASSTHSRAPCLATDPPKDISLAAVTSILLLCYSVNHLPVLGLVLAESFVPHVIPPHWPVTSIPLWAGLLEGVLLPLVIALTDKAFVRRVASIYSRHRPSDMTKPPQGLHGKFRPFNNCVVESHRPMETVRFPITNGSLFTSLDGRIPIIHNYRRTKGVRTTGPLPSYCMNQGLGQRYCPPSAPQNDCGTQLRANIIVADINCDRKAEPPLSPFAEVHKPKDVGQCYTQRLSTSDLRQDPSPFPQNIQQLRETLFLENQEDSEDEYEDFEETCEEPIYATLSSRSACSATTAANDDFEFYQQEEPREKQAGSLRTNSVRRRISRSSSMDRILNRQETDEDSSQSDEGRLHRPLYRQQPPPPRRPRLGRPLSRRGLPPTPPPPRRLAPVLSVDSLVAALHQADVSYLDTGDLCRHREHSAPVGTHQHRSGSVPDLKKVFYTGFL